MLIFSLLFILAFLIFDHLKNKHSSRKNQLFYLNAVLSILAIGGILNIPYTTDADFNLFITFSLLWFSYALFLLVSVHKETHKVNVHKAREHLGEHVRHMTDEGLHSHLKHH